MGLTNPALRHSDAGLMEPTQPTQAGCLRSDSVAALRCWVGGANPAYASGRRAVSARIRRLGWHYQPIIAGANFAGSIAPHQPPQARGLSPPTPPPRSPPPRR